MRIRRRNRQQMEDASLPKEHYNILFHIQQQHTPNPRLAAPPRARSVKFIQGALLSPPCILRVPAGEFCPVLRLTQLINFADKPKPPRIAWRTAAGAVGAAGHTSSAAVTGGAS